MKYISLFSGIEAASCAWVPLGWEPIAFSEVDPFCCDLLSTRYPDVPNLGDIREVDWRPYRGAVDVVVGGSPCQSFSIAGGREGLDGESRLMYEFIRAVGEVRPRWFLWENVPGVFTTDKGRAFGILLSEMEELGYGLAWRVLDAQFFGLAQRRKRVFLVGCLGNGGCAAAVLFERESVSGNTLSGREKRAQLSSAGGSGSPAGGWGGYCLATTQANAELDPEVSPTLSCHHEQPMVFQSSNGDDVVGTLCARDFKGIGSQYVEEGKVIAFAQNGRGEVRLQNGDGTLSGALEAHPGMKQQTFIVTSDNGALKEGG